MTNNNFLPNGLYNGIYLQTKEYDVNMHHLDTAHLLRMNAGVGDKYADSTDLGMITPWITTGYMERNGIFDMISNPNGVNRVMIDGHIARYQYPLASQPNRVLEYLGQTQTPGIDGSTFKVRFAQRQFGNGAIISPDKFLQVELVVTPDEIFGNEASGFVYTLKMNTTNGKYKFFPMNLLQPGTIFFRTGSIGAEYSTLYDSLPNIKTGHREYYLHVGEGHAHKHFSVTREAAYSKIADPVVKSLQEYRKVCEMYKFAEGSPSADAVMRGESPVDSYMKDGLSKPDAARQVKKDLVKSAYIPVVEAIAMKEVERDVEFYAVWGSGGTMKLDGKQEVNLPVGLFHQFNMGSFVPYNIPKFTLERLEAILTSRLKDKMDPYGKQIIRIGTGRGGLKIARTQLREKFKGMNFVVMGDTRYIVGSDNQKLHLETQNFMSYRWEYGVIEFVHVPALDPIYANEISNPVYLGERLSSFIFIIDDLSGEGGNIQELVYGPNWDFNHFYKNGKLAYEDMGTKPHHGDPNIPGFNVYIEKRLKAYRLVDPTKTLIIKPIDPNTGKMIFEPVYA